MDVTGRNEQILKTPSCASDPAWSIARAKCDLGLDFGDGILAYFGYPVAHEDDAERTVRAGLDIIAAVARLETRAEEPLAVRIGIATGVVVIGDLSREGALREHAVVGDTPNLAARLQTLAEPGTIVLAASTRRLLGHLFRLRDLGRHELKGISCLGAFRTPVASALGSIVNAGVRKPAQKPP